RPTRAAPEDHQYRKIENIWEWINIPQVIECQKVEGHVEGIHWQLGDRDHPDLDLLACGLDLLLYEGLVAKFNPTLCQRQTIEF
ncbi:MAG: hypothetical protein KBA58_03495, partial [Methanomassiliicoccales archaeon]|nr:hypothetical protein [Methanomassiliicoccales archaeon]